MVSALSCKSSTRSNGAGKIATIAGSRSADKQYRVTCGEN